MFKKKNITEANYLIRNNKILRVHVVERLFVDAGNVNVIPVTSTLASNDST